MLGRLALAAGLVEVVLLGIVVENVVGVAVENGAVAGGYGVVEQLVEFVVEVVKNEAVEQLVVFVVEVVRNEAVEQLVVFVVEVVRNEAVVAESFER